MSFVVVKEQVILPMVITCNSTKLFGLFDMCILILANGLLILMVKFQIFSQIFIVLVVGPHLKE